MKNDEKRLPERREGHEDAGADETGPRPPGPDPVEAPTQSMPKDLVASLSGLDDPETDAPRPAPVSVDLELDDLLGGHVDVTEVAPTPVPEPESPEPTVATAPVAPPSRDPVALDDDAFDPFADLLGGESSLGVPDPKPKPETSSEQSTATKEVATPAPASAGGRPRPPPPAKLKLPRPRKGTMIGAAAPPAPPPPPAAFKKAPPAPPGVPRPPTGAAPPRPPLPPRPPPRPVPHAAGPMPEAPQAPKEAAAASASKKPPSKSIPALPTSLRDPSRDRAPPSEERTLRLEEAEEVAKQMHAALVAAEGVEPGAETPRGSTGAGTSTSTSTLTPAPRRGVSAPPRRPSSPSGLFPGAAPRRRPEVVEVDPSDQGAVAARSTFRYRKPREEHMPLVGTSTEVRRERAAMLVELAGKVTGPKRADVLVAAAELHAELGDSGKTVPLYRAALEANPKHLVAIRALRSEALRRAAFREVAEHLTTEAGLALSRPDKALALTALAEVELHAHKNPAAAEKAARTALSNHRSVAGALLLAEVYLVQGKHTEALSALQIAADEWSDPRCKSVMLEEIARSAEEQGHLPRAQKSYEAALAADAESIEAWLGLARTARGGGNLEKASDALVKVAALLPASIRDAFLRVAARVVHLGAHKPEDAVALLADAKSRTALEARADAARESGDREGQMAAVEQWAGQAGGTERALALCSLAELRGATGDLAGADEALRDAALADDKLNTIRLVRELLVLQYGMEPAAEITTTGTLRAAAKIAHRKDSLERELGLLEQAIEEGVSPLTADVLALDLSLLARDRERAPASLRRQADRVSPEHKLGPLLGLADYALDHDQPDVAEAVLEEARAGSPGNPLVLRPLARHIRARDPKRAATLWLEEASSTEGSRAGFAAVMAARLLEDAGEPTEPALERAVTEAYPPAVWTLEGAARAAGDAGTLGELEELMATFSTDPVERAGRWVRVALIRASESPEAASALLERARGECPGDAIVLDLELRLCASAGTVRVANLLEAASAAMPPHLARVARLRAARYFEHAGEHGHAADLYRNQLEATPDDPFTLACLDRAELAAGEHARVAERRFAAVRRSEDKGPLEKVAALEALSNLDLYDRNEPASAVLSLQSILEVAPGHLPSLRTLERYFMDKGRDGDLLSIEEQLRAHLTHPGDAIAHARLAARLKLAPADADGAASDDIITAITASFPPDLWLARRLEGVARARGDRALLRKALEHILSELSYPRERTTLALRLADLADGEDAPLDATAETLATAAAETPEHPTAKEQLAMLYEEARRYRESAEAYEAAARTSGVRRRGATLFYRAALLWKEKLDRDDLALAAFMEAARLDVAYADIYARAEKILLERGESTRLLELTKKRLEAGGDAAVLVDLHMTRTKLFEDVGDRDGMEESLRAALSLQPERVDALKRLATLALEEEEWRTAAEALIRVARLRHDRDELRWVFFTLGDIYDRHMPDRERAEAAYKRVLKIVPDDVETLERLADLYALAGKHAESIEVLRELATRQTNADRTVGYRLRVAEALERAGDLRTAEAELEKARRQNPIHVELLRSMTEFYERNDAQSALAMHVSRGIADFRRAALSDPERSAAWSGLVEVLSWRQRGDAASCCASAAAAVGMLNIELAKRINPDGGVPGVGAAASRPALDELLAPQLLSPTARRVFMLASEAFEKTLAFDVRGLRAEKLPKDAPFRQAARKVGEWFGTGEVQLVVTSLAPRLCIPVSSSPPTVAIGRDLLRATEEVERLFLLTRAVKVAVAHLSVTVQAQPEELALAMNGLIHAYHPDHVPQGVDAKQLAAVSKKMGKAVPRKARDELSPLLYELAGFDPAGLGLAASELADRVGLLAVGSVPRAISALLKLANQDMPEDASVGARVQAIKGVTEAWSLLSFAISEAHFDARQRSGVT